MVAVPINEPELYDRLHKAVIAIEEEPDFATLRRIYRRMPLHQRRHREAEHSVPSPSICERCRLQQWFIYKQVPRTEEVPIHSYMAMAQGVSNEPYMQEIFERAGFRCKVPDSYVCAPGVLAHPDLLVKKPRFIVEFKKISGYGFKDLHDVPGGVKVNEPVHYAQMQLYLHDINKPNGLYAEWCLYCVVPDSFGMTQAVMRQRKDRGYDWNINPFYLEWVAANDDDYEVLTRRAEMLKKDHEQDTPPPREYDAVGFDDRGKALMPCGYCSWRTKCREIYQEV